MPRGIFARLLELAHEEGDALLEDAVVPPSRRLTPPRRRRSSATRKRGGRCSSVNLRTRHAPGLLLQRQDRHDAGQFQDADGHLHVVLEPRSQHARAVFGAGVRRQGGGGRRPTALRR